MEYSDIKDMLKDARNLATGANDIQTVNILKDIQLEVYDLLEDNRVLRDELHDLRNQKIQMENFEYSGENNVYFKKGNNAEIYCPSCLDGSGKIIHMMLMEGYMNYIASCPVCKHKVSTKINNPNYQSRKF
ncbi:MAG: hypothetical protein KC455_03275 [Carnobacterium sp.]|nr:hypothetical protein [Carnobacterium sp.]